MKKIISILLAFALIFSFTACNKNKNDDKKDNPGKEISLVVPDDSTVPTPTYSSSLTNDLKAVMQEFGIDNQTATSVIDELVYPVLKNAKVPESSVKAIIKYYNDSQDDIEYIMNAISGSEAPSDMDAFMKMYLALIKGAVNTLNPDEVGKVVYELVLMEDMPWSDPSAVEVVEKLNRDDFVIVSRFGFKIINSTLALNEDLIDLALPIFGAVGEVGDIPVAEIVSLYAMQLDGLYGIYDSITDAEINKLIDIFVDVFVAVGEVTMGEAMTASEINSFKTAIKDTVAEMRAILTFGYKTISDIDIDKLTSFIEDAVSGSEPSTEDVVDFAKDALVSLKRAYNSLTSAQKAVIDDILKDTITESQYYVFEYNDDYYGYVKKSTKQFSAPQDLLNNPMGTIDTIISVFEKQGEGLTQEEEEIFGYFIGYADEFGEALAERLTQGLSTIGGVGVNPVKPMPNVWG